MIDLATIDRILFPPMTGWLLAAKIFFIMFDLGVIAFIAYVWITTSYIKRLFVWDLIEFFTYRAYTVRRIDKDWNNIKRRLLTRNETEFKLAVIEADLLVNEVLGRLGYAGKTLSEKLDLLRPGTFTSIDSIREADQVYQNLVNDPSYGLDYEQTKKVILIFEQGLKDVQAFTK